MVVSYPMGLIISSVALVEDFYVLLVLESYFGLDGCFDCSIVLSFYGYHYIFDEVVYL